MIFGLRQLVFIFLSLAFCKAVFAQVDSSLLDEFLLQVKTQSYEVKNIELDFSSQVLMNQIELAEFDFRGALTANLTKTQDPQRNPFSPLENEALGLGASLNKKWSAGFETSLNYNVSDNSIVFPTTPDLNYFFPDFSFQVQSNIIDDLVFQKSNLKTKKIKEIEKQLATEKNIKLRSVYIKSLYELVSLLEVKEKINLETEICAEVKKQNQKLSVKRKQRTISLRDYLLSGKEKNLCEINIKNLENEIFTYQQNMKVTYGIDKNVYLNLKVDQIFGQLKQIFENVSAGSQNLNLEDNLEIKNLKQKMASLKIETKELNASAQPDLFLEARYGLRGLNENFSPAQDNIYNTDFSNFYIGLKLDLPFMNRKEQTLLAAAHYRKEILARSYQQFLEKKKSDLFVLKGTLNQNFKIYDNLLDNTKLSQQIFQEAQKDFNNGRIDFYNLTEFRKSLLQSKSQLVGLRSKVLINTVEFIDFYNYFEKYY